MRKQLGDLFLEKKPIIGMIHLAGDTKDERVRRALEELMIYEEEGVDGAIIEDYHGTPEDVERVLRQGPAGYFGLELGINVLRHPESAFELANRYKARFIQLDTVQTQDLSPEYHNLRKHYPNIFVFGGIRFKYTNSTGKSLREDLLGGVQNCDAIVTTGEGTGIETPIEKLRGFKRVLRDFPLITGAGVNPENIYEQLKIVDGAIIGSFFKPGKDTHLPVDRFRVRYLMDIIKEIRSLS